MMAIRSRLVGWALLAVSLIATACGGAPDGAGDGAREVSDEPFFVYVSPDPLGVNPFLMLGETGLEKAGARHDASTKVLESEDPTTREENVRAAIDDGADLVIVLGFEFNDILARLAPAAPDVDFLIVDQCMEDPPANVYCAVFKEYEASFLLGAMAALLSETRHVGVLGVVDIPFLHRYTDGFREGARHIDPDTRVSVRWVGGENPFSDPVRAKEQALAMAAEGVDHLFAAAAAGNFGVFEAAREQGFFAFGLDVNQCPAAPQQIVDNLMKRVDLVIEEAVDAILDGTREKLLVYGIATPGLDLVALPPAARADGECLILRHPEVVKKVQQLAEEVVAGRLGIEDPMGLL